MPELFGLAFFAAIVFWVVMLVDCLHNRTLRGGGKVGWIFLLVFLGWIGMLLYFFLACSFSPTARRIRTSRVAVAHQWWQPYAPSAQPYQPYQPRYQTPPPVPSYVPPQQPLYQPYQQGYQAQTRPDVDREELVPEASIYESHYEQPQATYPAMPPQQQ